MVSMSEKALDDAAHLIVWSVRRAIDFDDPTEMHEGPAWLAGRLAYTPLAPDIVRLALREAVRALEEEEDYARALALAARFAADAVERLGRAAAA
jgi:hypothetical protein